MGHVKLINSGVQPYYKASILFFSKNDLFASTSAIVASHWSAAAATSALVKGMAAPGARFPLIQSVIPRRRSANVSSNWKH